MRDAKKKGHESTIKLNFSLTLTVYIASKPEARATSSTMAVNFGDLVFEYRTNSKQATSISIS